MSEYTVFPNAPITEALLDIRVQLPPQIDLDKLNTFHNFIKERFPQKEDRIFVQTGIEVSPKGLASLASSSKHDGYLFRSTIENKVVQARLDGFTFNKLKPYKNWESLRTEARELWNIYSAEIAHPIKVLRIALRYINKIEIPMPMKEFKEYILTIPEVAPNIPQALFHFFMQLVIPNPEIEAIAVITQTIEPVTQNPKIPLIFDIEVFKERDYVDNKEEIWNDFEKLRIFKNEIFFNSITDRAKELFK